MTRRFAPGGPQYFQNTSVAPVSTGYPLSISVLLNTQGSGTNRAIMSLVNTSTAQRHLMYLGTADGVLIFSHDGASFSQGSSATGVLVDGTWNQIGVDIQGDSYRNTVVNGVLGTPDTGTRLVTGLNQVYVGAYNDGSGLVAGFYNFGNIADIGVWNATLTQDEWTSLSKGVSPRLIRPQNLVSYWPMFVRGTNEEDWFGSVLLTASASAPTGQTVFTPVIYPGSHRPTPFGADAPVVVTPPAKGRTEAGGIVRKRRYQVEMDGKVYEFKTEQQAIGALNRAHEVARKAIREREKAAKQVVVVAKPEPVTPPTIVVPDDSAALQAAAEETNRKIAVAYAQAQMRAEAIYAAYLEQEDEDEAVSMLLH